MNRNDSVKQGCPYSILDFGRLPRLAAEKASGLVGTETKSRALEANSSVWRTYDRAYKETLDAMNKECKFTGSRLG